jgi:hypothetical protein
VAYFSRMTDPTQPRRLVFGAAKKFLLGDKSPEAVLKNIAGLGDAPPRPDDPNPLPTQPQRPGMSRSRDRILTNLDDMYREAFERAKTTGDSSQMATLDFAYRREQLYFEILLDIRDALERR